MAVTTTHGPKGTPRPVIMAMLLTIVTFGLWSLYWVPKTHGEIKAYDGTGLGGLLGLVVFIVFSPATAFLLPHEIEQMERRAGRPSRVNVTTGLWVLLPLIGIFVWFHKAQTELNDFWPTAP
jgi:hypothetical protein